MSRRQSTSITLSLTFRLPPRTSLEAALWYVKTALDAYRTELDNDNPMKDYRPEGAVIKLEKKETVYL